MSVWNDPHYRSEPLLVVTKFLTPLSCRHPNVHALCDFEVDAHDSFPDAVPAGNFKDSVKKKQQHLPSIAYQIGHARSRSFELRFTTLPEPIFGLNAVYKLFSEIYRGRLKFKPEFDEAEALNFSRKLIRAFGPATYASPLAWEDWSKKAYSHWEATGNADPFKWYQSAEAIRHLKVAKGISSYKAHCRKAERRFQPLPYIDPKLIFGTRNSPWNVYQHRNVTILEKAPKVGRKGQSYVLLTKDLNRLSQLLESTGRVFEYLTMYADQTGGISTRLTADATQIMELLVTSFEKGDAKTVNSICRSMDIGMYIYLSDQAGSLATVSQELQRNKGFDGYYDKVFPLKEYVGILSHWKVREAMELASIRKILPVPDFCIFSAMEKNRKMHYSPHSQIPTGIPGVDMEDFSLYWSWSMIRNFYDRHKRCPGTIKQNIPFREWHQTYPDMQPIHIPYSQIEDIDFYGTFVFRDYSYAEHELRKDKTMAPNRLPYNMTAADYKALPLYEQNQIAKFILDPSIKPLNVLREEALNGNESFDYVSMTAIKPEAKKEDGRMFYMANDAQRVMMSEVEANIADYLVHKAGNSAGISDIDLAYKMSDIASVSTELNRKVYVSFDLEKWSPKMNPALKRLSYEKWSYAFGLPHILSLLKVSQNSRLAFLKHNVHHEYINPGQDLEGYDAKKNTAMHIEVMSYAINVCRREGLLKKGAKLLALIDDGGMSLEFEYTATNDEIWACIHLIEKIYNMTGLRISWDKTFVSESLFQYLNEVYYHGFKVTPGLKAFLRLGKLNDVPARTIMDDLDAIAGSIQGALKAGASYRMSFAAYILEVYKTMKRWSRFKGTMGDSQMLCAMFPVALGGLGVRSLLQLATNESINPLTSALGNLKAFAMYYQADGKQVNDFLNVQMKVQHPEAFIRAPQSIRQVGNTLNLQRFAIKMKEWILVNARNPYITNVLAAIDKNQANIMVQRVNEMTTISAVGLRLIADLQPDEALNLLVTKLQRSNTAAELLGHRDCIRIAIANRYQAERVITHFGKELHAERLSFRR